MAYSPSVERWRSTVAKYFKPEDVDKALYVINGESGGNPKASGDGGSSIGLFQMNRAGGLGTGSSVAQLEQAEYNIKLAAQAVYGGSGWGPWGEGTSYKGQKFGALGNNPYKGSTSAPSVSNARASSGITTTGVPLAAQTQTQTKKKGLGSALGNTIFSSIKTQKEALDERKAATAARVASTPATTSPTGDYSVDTASYWAEIQAAYAALQAYQAKSSKVLDPVEDDGMVYWYDDDGTPHVDEEGTRILQRALNATAALDRLMAAKESGLIQTGEGAASAYLTAEKEKRALAREDYQDYVDRVSDIVAVEDIPVARATAVASLRKAANDSRRAYENSPQHFQGAGWGSAGQPQRMSTDPIAKSLQSKLPAEAPSPYNIDPSAFNPVSDSMGMGLPSRDPQTILDEYNGVAPTGVETTGVDSGWTPEASPQTIPTPGMITQVPKKKKDWLDDFLSRGAVNYNVPNLPGLPKAGGFGR